MLRVQPLGTEVPGAHAYRILYQSSTSTGVAAPSGGMAFVPVGRAPATGRPIVAWAHPVIGDDVAPSGLPRAITIGVTLVSALVF